MFDDEPEREVVRDARPTKKSHSLPRTLDLVQCQLQKSSSQHFPEAGPGSGQSAYERLFGRPRPGEQHRTSSTEFSHLPIISGSRPCSPVVNVNKEKKKVFIPRARSRSRNVSGSPLRAKLETR